MIKKTETTWDKSETALPLDQYIIPLLWNHILSQISSLSKFQLQSYTLTLSIILFFSLPFSHFHLFVTPLTTYIVPPIPLLRRVKSLWENWVSRWIRYYKMYQKWKNLHFRNMKEIYLTTNINIWYWATFRNVVLFSTHNGHHSIRTKD